MDVQYLIQTTGHHILQQMTNDIYQQIVWNMIVYAAKVGIIAGIAIAVLGMALGILKFSTLDLTTYTGCMITNQNKGAAPFIAGFMFHMIASVVLGIAYLYVLHTFDIPGTLVWALALGVIHTLISGSLMFIFDMINPCVASKKVPRVGFAASAQGLRAVIAFTITHIVFAVIVVTLLTQ